MSQPRNGTAHAGRDTDSPALGYGLPRLQRLDIRWRSFRVLADWATDCRAYGAVKLAIRCSYAGVCLFDQESSKGAHDS